MKKTIFLVIAVLVFSFSLSQAQDPCAACLAPKTCGIADIGSMIPGCPNAKAVICFYCAPTQPIMNVEVLEISGICPGYEDACWDAVWPWVLENQTELCGQVNCENGSNLITVTMPLCWDRMWDGETITLTHNYWSCDLRCVKVMESCWCTCTPICDFQGCVPHLITTTISATTVGDGECEAPIPPKAMNAGEPWTESEICVPVGTCTL